MKIVILQLCILLSGLLSGCTTVYRSEIIVDVPYTYEIKEKAESIFMEFLSEYNEKVGITVDLEIDAKKRRLYYVIRYLFGDKWGKKSEDELKNYMEIVIFLQEKLREAGIAYRVRYREIVKPDWR